MLTKFAQIYIDTLAVLFCFAVFVTSHYRLSELNKFQFYSILFVDNANLKGNIGKIVFNRDAI